MKKLFTLYFSLLSIITLSLLPFSSSAQLVITEIMYNPPEQGNDSTEFIEFYNPGPATVDLTGYTFTEGVTHTFGSLTIDSGAYFVIAIDSTAFRNTFGFGANDQWTSGALSNSGEDIALNDGLGNLVDSVDFEDGSPWPPFTDSEGASLALCDFTADNNDPNNWSLASSPVSGVIIDGKQMYANPGAATVCISINITQSDTIVCNGDSSTALTAIASGATAPYQYVWSTNDSNISTSGLPAGTYTVTVTDFNNFIGIQSYTFAELPLIVTDTVVSDSCSYTWPKNGTTYVVSGIYTEILTSTDSSSLGCDSVLRLNLTLLTSSSTVTAAACDTFTWAQNGVTYTQSGLYTDTLVNAAGCDSVVTLDLSIQSNDTTFTVLSCTGFYQWRGNTFVDNGVYRDTVPNSFGCDSVLILDLTISLPDESFDTVTTCDQYVWVRDTLVDTLNVSGDYKDTISTAIGCDSIVNLSLTILNSTTAMFSDTACDQYVWMVSSSITRTYTTSGIYTEVIPNSVGCDSTMTLNLTINNSSDSSVADTACFAYTWAETGITYTNSGSYRDTIPNSVGCDSIVTLELVINIPDVTIIRNGFDLIAGANGGGATFRWIDCGNGDTVITGETSNIYAVVKNGFYAVEVTQNGCVDTSACINVVNIGIGENQIKSILSIHPNPAKDNFTIEVSDASKNEVLQLFDLTGSLLKEISISAKKNQINVQDLSEGIYLIKYGAASQKLIIQK